MISRGVPNVVFEIEIGTMAAFVGEKLAASGAEFFGRAVLEGFVEILVGVLLDRETGLIEELEIFDQIRRFVEIDEDADATALGRRENRVEQPDEIEFGKLAIFRMEQNFLVEVVRQRGGEGGRHRSSS
jgi:hypothetical protein